MNDNSKISVQICDKHIGGKLAALLFEQWVLKGWIEKTAPGQYHITTRGIGGFSAMGVDMSRLLNNKKTKDVLL